MKLYKDIYDIPIYNWNKIQESFIKEKPDFTYLIKSGRARKKDFEKLHNQYYELLYQLPAVDVSLNKSWLLYNLEMEKYQTLLIKNQYRELQGLKPIKIQKYPANKAFREYFEILQESYEDFEFEICFLNPNFEKIYKTLTGKDIPKDFNLELEFFLIEEFIEYLKSFDLEFFTAVLTGYDTFIHSEKRKFSEHTYGIDKINERLESLFRQTNEYNKWFIVRHHYFSLNKMNFRAKSEQTILNDVIKLNQLLAQEIDIKTITVGQLYNNYKEEADRKIEQSKPKAAGHGDR